jgi:hypothetical protein
VLPEPGERSAGGALNPAHVFHVSLSLGADQGRLPDGTWADIAGDYVTAMGFTAAGGKAECQWVAVRHGLSAGGNDHLHIAVCLVREDGTRASDWRSKLNSRRAADAVEVKYGLRPVRDVAGGRGLPRIGSLVGRAKVSPNGPAGPRAIREASSASVRSR